MAQPFYFFSRHFTAFPAILLFFPPFFCFSLHFTAFPAILNVFPASVGFSTILDYIGLALSIFKRFWNVIRFGKSCNLVFTIMARFFCDKLRQVKWFPKWNHILKFLLKNTEITRFSREWFKKPKNGKNSKISEPFRTFFLKC